MRRSRDVIARKALLLLCIVSQFLYWMCLFVHVSRYGHMQIPPYDNWDHARDIAWIVGFALFCMLAFAAKVPGRFPLLVGAGVLYVSRIPLESGGGRWVFAEAPVSLCMVMIVVSALLPRSAPLAERPLLAQTSAQDISCAQVVLVAACAFPIFIAAIYTCAYYYPTAMLKRAVYADDTRTIERLAALGVRVDWPEMDGHTALHRAARAQKAEVCRVLLEHGADVNARGGRYERTPLHDVRDGAVAQILLDYGADVNAKDRTGKTPLHDAVWSFPDVTEVLLSRGADVDAPDEDGYTALHVAAPASARLLILAGADVNYAGQDASTPLHFAVRFPQDLETVRLLLANGAEVNARDSAGNTPLHAAAKNAHVEAVGLLLEHGADAAARTEDGKTPRDLAEAEGHTEVVQLLEEHARSAVSAGGRAEPTIQPETTELSPEQP